MALKVKNPNLDLKITDFRLKINSKLLGKKSPLMIVKKATNQFIKQSSVDIWKYTLEGMVREILDEIKNITKEKGK